MKISTKERYALMLDIALHDTMNSMRVKDIAKRQDISVKYLEQIISVLVRAEYLRRHPRSQGGYRLTKKPEDYKGRHDSAADRRQPGAGGLPHGRGQRLLPGIRVRDTAVVGRSWIRPSRAWWTNIRWLISSSGTREMGERLRDLTVHADFKKRY